jgi:hypothetical protein
MAALGNTRLTLEVGDSGTRLRSARDSRQVPGEMGLALCEVGVEG